MVFDWNHALCVGCVPAAVCVRDSHLDEDVEAQTVDVVDVAQSKQAGEQAATEHAHGQVQSDGQALPDDAAAQRTVMTSQ